MKRVLSLVLVLALVLGMIPVGFAADMTSGEWLKENGLVEGYSDGTLGEADKLTRAQLMVLLSQMYGVKEDAAAYPIPPTFSDVEADAWYAPYVAYAQNQKWTSGYPDGTFKPEGTVSDKELATFMIKALGYEVTDFDAAVAQAATVGFEVMTGTELTRGDAFASMEEVVKEVPKKDETQPLGVELGVVEEETPEPTAVAVKIDSAVSLNAKMIEVSLDEAGTKVDATVFTVEDEDGKAVEVKSAMFAGWDTDMETVLVTLETETTAGTLYTVKSGETTANFGGRAADETAPKLTTVTPVDTFTFKLTFNEAVDVATLKLDVTEKLDSDELAITNMEYASKDVIEITTAEQVEELYELKITAVADLAGNEIDADITKTFVGKEKPSADLTLTAADAEDSMTVIAKFAASVDETTALNIANYTVENVNSDEEIKVVAAAMASDDSSTANVDESKLWVELTLAESTKQELYKLTVKDVMDFYGNDLKSNQSDTFVGKEADEDALTLTKGESTSNTEITLTFDDKVDADTTMDMFTVTDVNADKELTILSIKVSKEKVTLTTEAQEQVLYEVVVKEGIKDTDGNATEKDLKDTFVGSEVESKISSFSVTRDSDTVIVVDFNRNVGDNALDVAFYNIDGGVGYPEKVEAHADADKVKLTIPETTEGEIYTLTVSKGVENSDGVVSTDDLDNTFVGQGTAATLPEVEAVMAADSHTLKIYFDRDVDSKTIKGKVWDGSNLSNAGTFMLSADGTNYANLGTDAAYQDPTNDKVLVVRNSAAAYTDTLATSSNNTFILRVEDTAVMKKDSDGNKATFEFAYDDDAPTGIVIEGVSSVDDSTLKIYFDQPVKLTGANLQNIADIAKKADNQAYNGASTINLANNSANKVDEAGKIWEVGLASAMTSSEVYELIINPSVAAGDISGLAGVITIKDTDSDTNNIQQGPIEFAGTDENPSAITAVFAKMTDKRTIEVVFPTDMTASEAATKANYKLYSDDGTTQIHNSDIFDVDYDADTNTATIYLVEDINSSTGNYYLGITKDTIHNATGTQDVNDGESTAGDLVFEFANSSKSVAKPEVKAVELADDMMSMTVEFTTPVAFDDNTPTTLAIDANNTILTSEYSDDDAGTFNTISEADLLKVMTINAMFV